MASVEIFDYSIAVIISNILRNICCDLIVLIEYFDF